MNSKNKKWLACLAIICMWLTTTGFTGLEVATTAGISSVMEQLSGDEIEEYKIQEKWDDKVLAKVEDYVSVRTEADPEAEVVGRLFKGDGGTIVESIEGWTKIHSGNVEGYVSNEYLAFGVEAYDLAQQELKLMATATTNGLRIREEAGEDSRILKNVTEGTKLEAIEEQGVEGWICVYYAEEKTGYVSADYVSLQYELGEAMTIEEIEAKEAEEKREKLKQQLEAFQADGNEVVLLAALIQAEGGGQPYEGQVAIGAVVMNRVKSPSYPGTIAEVIYSPGQFGPASNGSLAKYLGGPKSSCMQAAQEAINGYTTIGSYTHFKNSNSNVNADHIVIGNHVFY